MLCPNVMTVCDELAQAYSTITKVDAFAYASMNTSIGKLSPDPDWLGPVRNELTLLSTAGAQWQQQKPVIWAPLLSQFNTYYALFSGFAEISSQMRDDKDAWLEALGQLRTSLANAENASKAAEGQFILQINNLNNIRQVFDSSLNKAWAALAHEEQEMVALAAEVTALQDKVDSLQESINSAEISSGKSYIQSSVSISYTLVSTAGAEVPYLAIAGLVFTVGKLAYDLIVNDKEIAETIGKIVELRNKASQEAQAAAMSKGIIQLIDNFDKNLLAVQRQLPALGTMWANEKAKVDGAIAALHSGAKPTQYLELLSMSSAAATWKKLSEFATQLTQMAEQGKPVTLSTSTKTSLKGASTP
jgi:hypothetical protein